MAALPLSIGRVAADAITSDPAPLAAGEYSLTWSIDRTDFWSLPFSVSTAPAGNVYDQPNHYLEGPWNDWAYIYVPNGNLSQ